MGYREVEVAIGYPISEQDIEDALRRYAPDVRREDDGGPIPLEWLANACLKSTGVRAYVDKVYPRDAAGTGVTSYFVTVRRQKLQPYQVTDATLMREGTASRAVKEAFNVTGDLKAYMLSQ